MNVELKVNPPSGTIVLNRPDKRNAISRAMMDELAQAFFDLHQQSSVRAVILTGAGAAFSAGMDLAEMLAAGEEVDCLEQWRCDAEQYMELLETILRFPKPVIAAVNGPALAGGAGLALACDIAIAANDATFSLPEPRRGLVAGVVAPLLMFRLGGAVSARLLLTGEPIDAEEGRRLGVFQHIVPEHSLWAKAHEIAMQCARSPRESLQLSKRVLNEIIGEQLFTQLRAGAAASATARTTEAAAEGVAAFLEKRDPHWP